MSEESYISTFSPFTSASNGNAFTQFRKNPVLHLCCRKFFIFKTVSSISMCVLVDIVKSTL